ncbi:MAG TPA: PH domain-containing protein, partial [Pilimelia sp.]|nr:PH domain-containing protein [Pilimelia sp.]
LLVVLLFGAFVLSMISWYVTGYHIVGRELRVYEGLVWRRTRAIPLERLQAVEVVQPLLARLAGLAELRLEVVGGAKTEAPLAFLSLSEAVALRDRLLALAGRLAPAAPAPAGPAVPAGVTPTAPVETAPVAGRELHRVSNQDVVISQLLTPQIWSLPFALAFILIQTVSNGSYTFIGIASAITAMAGIVLQPVRRVLDDWNFRLARDQAGLRLRHGLLETRNQTVPVDRVQAIRATWPLLWRPVGWLRVRMGVAGYAGPDEGQGRQSDRLLPVGDLPTARRLVAEVLFGVDIAALPLTPPPRRARWLAPIAQPKIGAALTPEVFATWDGVLTRNLTLVPHARIQSVRVVQGPLQRMLRLATVHADTAGGLHAAAEHRELAEAYALAAELTDRARAARSRPSAA